MSSSTLRSVIDLARRSSSYRLKTLSGREDVELHELTEDPLVYAHWMSFILISGESVRIIFKAHFMTEVAQELASKTYGIARQDVSMERSLDFFREYCNLTAGQMKYDFAQNQIKVGASLPGLIRGFDEIFYKQKQGAVKNSWYLSSGGVKFICSAHFEVYHDFELKVIESNESTEFGDVEFL